MYIVLLSAAVFIVIKNKPSTVKGNEPLFSYYIDSEQVLEMPSKESGYTLSNESNCNNGVKLSFDLETYQITVNYTEFQNNSSIPTKCNLHFREALLSDYITSCGKNGKSFSDCLKAYNDKEKEELAFDGTSDNNLRYIG